MEEDWLEMEIVTPAAAVDLLGQSLLELGCTGVRVHEEALDTFEHPGDLPLPEGQLTVRAYFAATEDPDALRDRIKDCLTDLQQNFPDLMPARPFCRQLASEDWAHAWQQHFPPFEVGKHLLIQPSWQEQEADREKFVLVLDPGQAFGTGTHATTALCLAVIARAAAGPRPPRRVLDVGTGSGILALAAAALGAERVLACDLDPVAVQVARKNIQNNGLTERVLVIDSPLDAIEGRFDLVLANILASENIRLAEDFLEKMLPDSRLVLSGILTDQEDDVMRAYRTLPLELSGVDRREGWSCLTYARTE